MVPRGETARQCLDLDLDFHNGRRSRHLNTHATPSPSEAPKGNYALPGYLVGWEGLATSRPPYHVFAPCCGANLKTKDKRVWLALTLFFYILVATLR